MLNMPSKKSVFTFVLLTLSTTANAECTIETYPVPKENVIGLHNNDLLISLDNSDGKNPPNAWEGPISIANSSQKPGTPLLCVVDNEVSIIENPLWVGNNKVLYVPTYSGSMHTLYAINIQDCHVIWHSKKYIGDAVFSKNSFLLKEAGMIKLNRDCLPQ